MSIKFSHYLMELSTVVWRVLQYIFYYKWGQVLLFACLNNLI